MNKELTDRVVISGARGFVGKNLKKFLSKNGISSIPISRENFKNNKFPSLKNASHFIHLAGVGSESVDQDSFVRKIDDETVPTVAEIRTKITEVSEGNEDIKQEINNVAKKFNIVLYQDDLESIVKIMNLIDHEKFINYRYNLDKYFIVGFIIFLSSSKISILSQCGFNPVIPILGFLFKYFL